MKKPSIVYAVLAAALYAFSVPFSKTLLDRLSPMMMASMLYLGAGVGLLCMGLIRKGNGFLKSRERFSPGDYPFVAGMILLDIIAPFLLMIGLTLTTAANTSLLNNFEIVATSIIALLVFKEPIPRKLWVGILLITMSSIMLTFEKGSSLSFSLGSVFVLFACICWGLENNCTRRLSGKDTMLLVFIKGMGAGGGALLIALLSGERMPAPMEAVPVLFLGFVSYGLSIYFYVKAQRVLGAASTSAYYAIAPFLGVLFAWLLLGEHPDTIFFLALGVMFLGVLIISIEKRISDKNLKTI